MDARGTETFDKRVEVEVYVDAPPEAVWSQMAELPFLSTLPLLRTSMSVVGRPVGGGTIYKWSFRLPFGPTFRFDELVTEWVEGERISYRALSGWAMEFRAALAPEGSGTRFRIQLLYSLPFPWRLVPPGLIRLGCRKGLEILRRDAESKAKAPARVRSGRSILVNGWRVHYDDAGSGPPVLLLHGIPTSSFIWRRQIEALSRTHRVLAPDLLGWGLSEKPADFDYRISSYADVINRFLDAVGVSRVTLVAHDLGAAVGLQFAARHPKRVSRLAVLDTFAYMPFSKRLPWRLLYGFLYRLPLAGRPLEHLLWNVGVNWTNAFVAIAFHDRSRMTSELVARYRELNRDSRLTDLRVLQANGLDGLTRAVERSSLKIRVPTLILWAEDDRLFPPSAADHLQRNIPGSIVRTIPDCGHFLQEEKPELVNRYLVDFIDSPAKVA